MTRRCHRIGTDWLAAAGLTMLAVALTAPGIAAASPVPGIPVTPSVPLVRVTMGDAVSAAKPGDTLAYAITVDDKDTIARPMEIRLDAPANLRDIAVGDGGTLVGHELSWPGSLTPGRAVTVHFTAVVDDNTVQLTTTACAYLSGADRPAACGSDADAVVLPANGVSWESIAGSAALVLLVGGGVYALRRRRGLAAARSGTRIAVPDAREPVAERARV